MQTYHEKATFAVLVWWTYSLANPWSCAVVASTRCFCRFEVVPIRLPLRTWHC